MRVLLLGGTGAMGFPLVDILSKDSEKEVFVTTRKNRVSNGNVHYLIGNAKDEDFLKSIIEDGYDVIIDFMVYTSEELKNRISLILDHTNQYIFLSSSRVYANCYDLINENSPRLLDVCDDEEYLKTDEYALAKAREEDILLNSGRNNFTIIRPYITINSYCIKLGVYEKENWLYRALSGRTVVMPKDIANSITTVTFGSDVAKSMIGLIGNEKAYGQTFHVTTDESHTWGEILNMYIDSIEKHTGKKIKVKYVENSDGLMTVWNKWQVKYDRLLNRRFDNHKIDSVREPFEYTSIEKTIDYCIKSFTEKPRWNWFDARFEAWCDRQCGEWTPLKEIPGKRAKLSYLKHRILG